RAPMIAVAGLAGKPASAVILPLDPTTAVPHAQASSPVPLPRPPAARRRTGQRARRPGAALAAAAGQRADGRAPHRGLAGRRAPRPAAPVAAVDGAGGRPEDGGDRR